MDLMVPSILYLSFEECEDGPVVGTWASDPDVQQGIKSRLQKITFMTYSVAHWPNHTRQTNQESNVQKTLSGNFLKLAKSPGKINLAYQILRFSQGKPILETTPLDIAASLGLVAFVEDLVEVGADVNAQGGHYNGALQAAAQKGHPDLVGFLIDHGADINKRTIDGLSALHLAHCNKDIMEKLLQAGADISTLDQYGRTPLFFSRAAPCEETIRLLLNNGADENHRDQFGRTAQDVAVRRRAVRELLSEEPIPRCQQLNLHEKTNIAIKVYCDGCQYIVIVDFYYRKSHPLILPIASSPRNYIDHDILMLFTSKTKTTIDCCDCSSDNYDICSSCFSAGIRCEDSDHQLKQRFIGGGMISFMELSPWVKEIKLPNSKTLRVSKTR
jgi:hypothetical protein